MSRFQPTIVASLVCFTVLTLAAASHAGLYSNAVLLDGPIAYWRLGDAGPTADDATGNGHAGAADFANDLSFGAAGLVPAETGDGALQLGGFDRVIVPGFEKIGATGYSAEYWVKLDAYPTDCCASLVSDGIPSGQFFMMNYLIGPGQGTTGTIRPHYSFGNTPLSLTGTTVLALDTVYHVVTTWDASNPNNNNGKIYINGVETFTGNVTGNVPAPGTTGAHDVYLGRDGRENRPSNFVLDEVSLYDYPLSAAQVADHYNTGITLIPEPGSIVLVVLAALGLVPLVRRASR